MEPTKYTLIQPVPGAQEVSSFPEYVGYLIPFALGLAALLAVLQIVWGGFRRAAALGNESEIKDSEDRVTKAIWGLILALLAYLFLFTINPDLVNLRFFPEQVQIEKSQTEVSAENRQTCVASCSSSLFTPRLCVESQTTQGSWSCVTRQEFEAQRIQFSTQNACKATCDQVEGGSCFRLRNNFFTCVIIPQ